MIFRILIYFLCLLERESTLTKPDFPIIGNCTQQIFLFANPKTNVLQIYTDTKRTNSKSINTKTKNTDEGLYFLSETLQREDIGPQPAKKRTESPFQKIFARAVGSFTFVDASLRPHQFVSYVLPHIDCLRCVRVRITTTSLESLCYQTVGFFRCYLQKYFRIFFRSWDCFLPLSFHSKKLPGYT